MPIDKRMLGTMVILEILAKILDHDHSVTHDCQYFSPQSREKKTQRGGGKNGDGPSASCGVAVQHAITTHQAQAQKQEKQQQYSPPSPRSRRRRHRLRNRTMLILMILLRRRWLEIYRRRRRRRRRRLRGDGGGYCCYSPKLGGW